MTSAVFYSQLIRLREGRAVDTALKHAVRESRVVILICHRISTARRVQSWRAVKFAVTVIAFVPQNTSDLYQQLFSMNLDELKSIVSRGESSDVEFKASTGQRTEGAKTICAMLNGNGGFLLFGVKDNGVLSGQDVTADTLAKLVAELRKIEPSIPLEPETAMLENHRAVVIVRVPRGGDLPYTYDGRPYIRRGPTTSIMSRSEHDHLILERGHPSHRWELQPAIDLTLSDLDHQEIYRTVEEGIRRGRLVDPGTRDVMELLIGLGLVRDGQLLNASVVLFGQAHRLLPCYTQCLLRLARFRGTTMNEFIDNRQELGNAFDHFRWGQEFFRQYLPVAGRIVPGLFQRVDDPLYPPEALREALANAICHRDYSTGSGSVNIAVYDDRLEITSVGRLHFGFTPQLLRQPHASKPWNPLIARVFYLRGIIETWGRGTLKMAELNERAGLLPPEIEEQSGTVVVRFSPSGTIGVFLPDRKLSPLQKQLFDLIWNHSSLSLNEILVALPSEQPRRTVQDNLAILRRFRLIEVYGKGRGARWMATRVIK